MQVDAAAAEAAAKAPLPAPSLQEDLTLPGASTPAPAAAPVLSILQASWLGHRQLGAAGAQEQHSTAQHLLADQAHIGCVPLCLFVEGSGSLGCHAPCGMLSRACACCCCCLQGHLADQLLQVWEFACCFGPLLGLEQVPSPQQLERGLLGVVSHTGAPCSRAVMLVLPCRWWSVRCPAALHDWQALCHIAACAVPCTTPACLCADVSFAGTVASTVLDNLRSSGSGSAAPGDHAAAADAANSAPKTPAAAAGSSAAAVAAAAVPVSAEQLAFDAAAGSAWVQLHVAVLSVLVGDVFAAVSAAAFDVEAMRQAKQRELRAATPVVDETTWPEAARRLLAATATATFLAQVGRSHWAPRGFCTGAKAPSAHEQPNTHSHSSCARLVFLFTLCANTCVYHACMTAANTLTNVHRGYLCRVSPRAVRRAAVRVSWTCPGSCAAWRFLIGLSTWLGASTHPTSSAGSHCCHRYAGWGGAGGE